MLFLSFETLTFLCINHASVENECRNLTKEDAPDNGGLVCHWFREENSQHCQVKCNQGTNCRVLRDCRATIDYENFNLFAYITLHISGYEFPSNINAYESCGSTTGWRWTYKFDDPNAAIEPCIRKYLNAIHFESFIWNSHGKDVSMLSSCKKDLFCKATYSIKVFAHKRRLLSKIMWT